MSKEFNFTLMDANQRIETQQSIARKIVRERIDLDEFRRHSPLPLPPPVQPQAATVGEEEDSAV